MLDIAEIFRTAGPAYRERFAGRMLPSHLRAMQDIERCRTPALGGHVRQCCECGMLHYTYHSCRNRHCPKCHADDTHRWIEKQKARLLPCGYFLLTFTLPDELRPVARSHQEIVYAVLMQAAAQALLTLTADPRYLGAQPGILAVLHTWTRDLLFHPHVHFLVTAGGLSADGQAWIKPKNRGFLVPCRALSLLFRGKVHDGLRKHDLLAKLDRKIWRRKWVVHAQHAGTGEHVIAYLGRYIYRVAITNSRIESFNNDLVTFRYRENRTGEWKCTSLPVHEFIRRFLQHILPRGFTKVRYYGLFSSSCHRALEFARGLFHDHPALVASAPPRLADTVEVTAETPDLPRCPSCKHGVLIIVATLPRPSSRLVDIRAPP